jgi:hypothetical protein
MRSNKTHQNGLRMCAVAMLLAIVAGMWGYFLAPTTLVFVLAAVAAIIGLVGIGTLGVNYFAREDGGSADRGTDR